MEFFDSDKNQIKTFCGFVEFNLFPFPFLMTLMMMVVVMMRMMTLLIMIMRMMTLLIMMMRTMQVKGIHIPCVLFTHLSC